METGTETEPKDNPSEEGIQAQSPEQLPTEPELQSPVSAAEAAEAPAAEAPAAPQPELSEEERHERLKKALESLLFITDHPLPLPQLCKLAGVTQKESKRVVAAINELKQKLDDSQSAVQIVEVADGFQMGTRPAFAPFVKKLFTERMTMKLSTAAHETLSIVAYKQPLTRAEIEQIRGVEVIAAIETLLEKRLLKVVGRKESVGRPLLYGTTPEFLRHFGLRSLEDLPPLDSFTPADAPLGEKVVDEAIVTDVPPAEEVSAAEAAEPLPSCVEAQAKEFAAGEQMAEEAEAQEERTQEPQGEVSGAEAPETQAPEAQAAETPKRKSIWDD